MAATIMFRDFSFERRPPAAQKLERTTMNVSPSTVLSEDFSRPPTPKPSVGDLADDLDRQSLRDQAVNSNSSVFPYDTATHTGAAERPTYSRIATASLRLQRQTNTRKHRSPSHLETMSKLVARMIEETDQCNVCETPSSPSPRPSSRCRDDEGIDMDYTSADSEDRSVFPLSFRRAGDRLCRGAAVVKKVRMRRRLKTSKKK
ncbi:uncharacterized protein EI97DRAFT_431894 [Westerdykella ornata]|uniref:Uncharacterized protein n=1 Tax=Westerdykella ornata TaxID=318751 RepID=A0A6A6JMU4_WESOR|nr:uncharacterized protein EI97DRAFT_431894 [Westerdykella ornata]KAF2277822.1 hypothetical protein EI97DRAFT_431894 [Westerdykella ornata]